MTKSASKTIFWVGTLSSAVLFLYMTFDFHKQGPRLANTAKITPEVVAGKKVWHKYNCNDCHTILGFGGYYAPDMTKAFYRLGKNNIISVVMNPEKVYQNSFRKMPHLGVTKQEAEQLVAFLQWTADIENRNWPPQDVKYVRAAKLRAQNAAQALTKSDLILSSCGGCHSFQNQGRNVAGDFDEIAKAITYDRATLVRFILNPEAVKPGVGMPPQAVSEETAGQIADFVLSLK
ncbi:MAG: c-type cytochrome [Deltaproteobacteria bacterium]|nr:c-type cytochrome [Deltaproteobacteria bacterium]